MQEVFEITHRVYLDVDVDKQHIGISYELTMLYIYFCKDTDFMMKFAGRIVIGLYGDVVPKTVGKHIALSDLKDYHNEDFASGICIKLLNHLLHSSDINILFSYDD